MDSSVSLTSHRHPVQEHNIATWDATLQTIYVPPDHRRLSALPAAEPRRLGGAAWRRDAAHGAAHGLDLGPRAARDPGPHLRLARRQGRHLARPGLGSEGPVGVRPRRAYVGPFLELGLGASAGSISTRSGTDVDESTSGVALHIPFTIGLAVGPHHELDLAFAYLFYPGKSHISGAAAIGFRFPLR